MLTTQAAILVEQGRELIVDRIALPDELGVGQVLVRVETSGICGSQLGEIAGVKGPDRFLPHLLGHEGIGRVLRTGPGVSTVSEGQQVVLHWRKGRGIEGAPPKYDWNGRVVNAGFVTTFNQHAIVSENRLTPVAEDLDKDLGALMGCAITTGFGVVENDAQVRIGESVVVFGAGGVGLNVIQAAKLVGAHPIIAVDLHDNRLALAAEMGATHTVNSAREDAFPAIAAMLGGRPLDVFIDNTGVAAIVEQAYEFVGKEGRLVLVGVPKVGTKASFYTLPLHFGKSITGSEGGSSMPTRDIPRYLTMFAAGLAAHAPLISKRYRLADINQALDDMRSGAIAGRAIIDMEDA